MPYPTALLSPLATSPAQAFRNLLLGEVGLALLIGGAVGLYLLWYLRGRDKPVGLMAEYLREPPSDLHPGLVGTLIDEHANKHDVVATFVNLAYRGVIRMTPVASKRGRQSSDYAITLLDHQQPLSRVEQLLLEVFFGRAQNATRRTRALSEVRPDFQAAIPRIKEALYQEVVERGYFTASPQATRLRYRNLGLTIAITAVVIGCPIAFILPSLRLLIAPVTALVIIGVGMLRLSRAMPAKTHAGSEAAARWQAFRRYLEKITDYEDVSQSQTIFSRYLPYATAFGMEQNWLKAFMVNDPRPSGPLFGGGGDVVILNTGGGHYGGGSGTSFSGPGDLGGGGLALPDLPSVDLSGGVGGAMDAASSLGGAGLDAASEGLSGLLDAAASIFDW